jgi:predicted ATPase
LITGPNGSGKSNLYRALRLLAETAQGGVVNALAVKAELESTFWAGPEVVSRRMKSGEVAIEGGPRNKVKRLRMGFAADDFSYAIALGCRRLSCQRLPSTRKSNTKAFGWALATVRPVSWWSVMAR